MTDLLTEALEDEQAGRLAAAAKKLDILHAQHPEDAKVLERLALVHLGLGDLPAAASAFGLACDLQPNSATARNNLAVTLARMGLFVEAIAEYDRILKITPDFIEARFGIAQIQQILSLSQEAIANFRIVVTLDPGHKLAWYRLGYLLFATGYRNEAQHAYQQALNLDPDFVEAMWAHTMSTLPLAYDLDEMPEVFYEQFSQRLDALDRWFSQGRDASGYRAVGNQQPYYIVYHNRNNRDVLSRYGDLCTRLMAAWYGNHPVERRIHRAGPINITIVSGDVHDHSMWAAIVRGWCQHLDKAKFCISLLYTDSVVDHETELARVNVATFVHGDKPVAQWVDIIRDLKPDVLLYPEVGMDKMCIKLAALRLAPVQAVAWGHPETTGMPTIDYFLSAEAFETLRAQDNYRETFVPLAGIGSAYAALNPPTIELDVASIGLDRKRPIVLCPGTPYKFAPEHDWTFAVIAGATQDCQIVFVTDNIAPHLSTQVANRIRREFDQRGLDYSRFVHFIDRQTRSAYFSLMRQSALYLDTIAFSGFNTAMQAFECGLPVVTVEGQFLRNRFASGILRKMGVHYLVTADAQEYVSCAVELLNDDSLLKKIQRDILDRFPSLLDQRDSIRSLEAFLELVMR